MLGTPDYVAPEQTLDATHATSGRTSIPSTKENRRVQQATVKDRVR
jgi:hypothetical protein